MFEGRPFAKAFWAALTFNSIVFLQGFALFGAIYAALPRIIAIPFILGYAVNMFRSKAQHSGALKARWWTESPIYAAALEYFGSRVALPDSLQLREDKQYLFGLHPHAVHMIGSCNFNWTHPANAVYRKFPGVVERLRCGAASVLWYVPYVRESLLWAGWIDVGRRTLEKHLSEGANIGIIIGGEQETLVTENGKDKVVLGGRKGFVRLAMRHGAHLVPTYTFNLNSSFSFHPGLLRAPRVALQRMFQVCIPVTFGRWGTPMPYPTPGLLFVIGEPIEVPAKSADSGKLDEAIVDELHAKYVAALQKLFEEFKTEAGYPAHAQLEIVDAPEANRVPAKRQT
jgi:hypothetical protein